MFSGYLQSGLYSGMDGKAGLAAWRWLMIFDGIIGIPVSLCGFLAIPDSPTTTRALWLKPRDREIGIQRMAQVGRKPPTRLSWRIVRDALCTWQMWLFPMAFACHVLGIRVYNYFGIYLKSLGSYSVPEVNNIPTAGYAYQIVMALVYSWVSDYYKTRWPLVCLACCMSMVGTIILSVYPEHNAAAMLAGWIMTYGETGAGALIMTMVNEACSYSSEVRILAIGWTEAFAYACSAWGILLAYPSGEAPRFSVGYEMATMFFALELVVIAMAA